MVLEIASTFKETVTFQSKYLFRYTLKNNFLWQHEFLIIFIHFSVYLPQVHLHKKEFILWRLWDRQWVFINSGKNPLGFYSYWFLNMENYFNALLLPIFPICETHICWLHMTVNVYGCAGLNNILLIFKSKTLCSMPPREVFQSQGNLKSILIFWAYLVFFKFFISALFFPL